MKNRFLSSAIVMALASIITAVPAKIASATQTTFSVTIIQSFGCGGSDTFTGGWCKMMVRTGKGNRYFVWYSDRIGSSVGSTVIVTYDGYYGWQRLTSANGSEASVAKVLKVNP